MMLAELENFNEVRIHTSENLVRHKMQVMKSYNKKVKPKTFRQGELVWKAILPLRVKDKNLGK